MMQESCRERREGGSRRRGRYWRRWTRKFGHLVYGKGCNVANVIIIVDNHRAVGKLTKPAKLDSM